MLISNSLFVNNASLIAGGAICIFDTEEVIIRDSIFIHNIAEMSDGGVINAATGEPGERLVLKNNLMIKNSAGDDFEGGGAVWSNYPLFDAEKNVFAKNSSALDGGAIYHSSPDTTVLNLRKNSFIKNTAARDGDHIACGDDASIGLLVANLFLLPNFDDGVTNCN